MQLSTVSQQNTGETPGQAPVPARQQVTEPNFSGSIKPIADFIPLPDFPQCAVGQLVDIGGYTGMVVEIVKQSMKVRSPEGATRSFNVNGLRKLYGPRLEPAPLPSPTEANEVAEAPPKREVIAEPDFDQPVKSITDFAGDPDFPKCAFGKLIDFRGYTGVVIEIVNQSLKVRSVEETTRSYNFNRLRELYGQKQGQAKP